MVLSTPGSFVLQIDQETQVDIKMWGAGGLFLIVPPSFFLFLSFTILTSKLILGGAGGTDYVSKAGGGGFSQGRFNMTSSDSYTVFVGQGGEAGGKVSMRQGGGGGGGTALLLFDLILAAGAGGGGGTATDIIPGAGGGMAGTSGICLSAQF